MSSSAFKGTKAFPGSKPGKDTIIEGVAESRTLDAGHGPSGNRPSGGRPLIVSRHASGMPGGRPMPDRATLAQAAAQSARSRSAAQSAQAQSAVRLENRMGAEAGADPMESFDAGAADTLAADFAASGTNAPLGSPLGAPHHGLSLSGSRKDEVSADEWAMRVDLAATYRLIAQHGWDDLVFTHISARVPGREDHYLVNPFGLLFEEITASNLIKVNASGEILQDTDQTINRSGFAIHAAIHQERDDAGCVIHLHTDDGAAVAAQRDGLLPLTQHAMTLHGRVAYHDYEGIDMAVDERVRLVHDLGNNPVMILRNHGTLAVGQTCADAYMAIYYLERACTMQIRALAGGAKCAGPDEGTPELTAEQAEPLFSGPAGDLVWPSLMRKLNRIDPSFRT